jgi:hypothetical protein
VASIQVTDVATATSTSVSWASGFATYVAGQNGTAVSGVQTARPTVYQWALSTPSISGTSTYTWSTGSYTAPTGWATTITTSPSAGYTLYSATVPLTDSATATTTTINWGTASIVTAGYAGSNGTSSRVTYARVASNPTPTSGNITTSGSTSFPTSSQSTTTWGFAATWSGSDPSPSSTNSLYQADGIYDPSTGNTTWSTPYISSLKVGALSAVSTNTGSLTVSGTLQANTAAVSGSTLTGSGAVIYSSGVFGIGTSSNNLVFDGTNLNINGGSNINITGQAVFNGANSASGGYAAIVANTTHAQKFGVYGEANGNGQAGLFGFDTGTTWSNSYAIYGESSNPYSYVANFYNYSGGNGVLINVTGSGVGLNIGGSSGTGINVGTVSGPAIQAVSLTGYGLELSGQMTINNSTLVNNLNAQNWNGISVIGFVPVGSHTLAGLIQVSYSGGTYYIPYYT